MFGSMHLFLINDIAFNLVRWIFSFSRAESGKKRRPEKLLINENEMDTFSTRWLHKIYVVQSFVLEKWRKKSIKSTQRLNENLVVKRSKWKRSGISAKVVCACVRVSNNGNSINVQRRKYGSLFLVRLFSSSSSSSTSRFCFFILAFKIEKWTFSFLFLSFFFSISFSFAILIFIHIYVRCTLTRALAHTRSLTFLCDSVQCFFLLSFLLPTKT